MRRPHPAVMGMLLLLAWLVTSAVQPQPKVIEVPSANITTAGGEGFVLRPMPHRWEAVLRRVR